MTKIITGKEKKDYRVGEIGMQLDEDVKVQDLLEKQTGCYSMFAPPGLFKGTVAPQPGPQPFSIALFMEVSREIAILKERIKSLEESANRNVSEGQVD